MKVEPPVKGLKPGDKVVIYEQAGGKWVPVLEFGPVEEVEITDKHGTMKGCGFTIGPKDAA